MRSVWLGPFAASALMLGCVEIHDTQRLPPSLETAPPYPPEVEQVSATAVVPGDTTVNAEKTLAYWKLMRGIAERKPSEDLNVAIGELKQWANEIRRLPAVGVDGELLSAAESLAREEERAVAVAQFVEDVPAREGRRLGLDRSFLDAAERLKDARSRLKGLRAKLSARYGFEFPPIEGT